MVSLIIGNAMSTVLAYAYGKSIAVICLTLILALPKYLLLLFDRFVIYITQILSSMILFVYDSVPVQSSNILSALGQSPHGFSFLTRKD